MFQPHRSWFLLCVYCLVCPLALAVSADSQHLLSVASHIHNHSSFPLDCLISLNGPSFTLNVERENSFWIDDDGEYVFDEIDDVASCIIPLHQQGLLASSLPVTDLFIKGNRPLLPASLVNDFLTNLTSLEHLYWESSVLPASEFLETFERQHPDALLHFRLSNHHFSDAQSRLLPGSLAGRSCLHSIDANIQYGGEDEPEHMPALERLLASAPNLKKLSLHIKHNGGCLRADEQPYSFKFDQLRNHQTFPPLEVLHLNGYDMDSLTDREALDGNFCNEGVVEDTTEHSRTAWNHREYLVKQRYSGPFDPSREEDDSDDDMILPKTRCSDPKDQGVTNVERWLDHMDWSQVHTLSLSNPSLHALNMLAPHPTSLKTLSINDVHAPFASQFLEKLPSKLTSLSLVDLRGTNTDSSIHIDLSQDSSLRELYTSITTYHRLTLQNLTILAHQTPFGQITSTTQQQEDFDQVTSFQASGGYADPTKLLTVPQPLNQHPYLTPQLVAELKSLPNLIYLHIDVPRALNASQLLTPAYENTISALQHLQHLTLHFLPLETAQTRTGILPDEISDLGCGRCGKPEPAPHVDTQITNTIIANLLTSIRTTQCMDAKEDTAERCFAASSGKETCEPECFLEHRLSVLEVLVGDGDKRICRSHFGMGPETVSSGRWICSASLHDKRGDEMVDLQDEIVCEGGYA